MCLILVLAGSDTARTKTVTDKLKIHTFIKPTLFSLESVQTNTLCGYPLISEREGLNSASSDR